MKASVKPFISGCIMIVLFLSHLCISLSAAAREQALLNWRDTYPTSQSADNAGGCPLCHNVDTFGAAVTAQLNAYGNAVRRYFPNPRPAGGLTDAQRITAIKAVEPLNPDIYASRTNILDAAGTTNLQEILKNAQPGWKRAGLNSIYTANGTQDAEVASPVVTPPGIRGAIDVPTLSDVSRFRPLNLLSRIEAGETHSCALTIGGGVRCWGSNAAGQLGDGTTTARLTAVDVSGLESGVVAVTVGSGHSCALTATGAVKCWGDNFAGQLGDGTTTSRLTPVPVTGLSSGAIAIAAGANHACALTNAGAVKCWGENVYGQIGDSGFSDQHFPVNVTGLSIGITAIAAGGNQTCALTSAGLVKCWGILYNSNSPVNASGLTSGIQAIAVGDFHVCALTTAGGAKCLGVNDFGQLGDGTIAFRMNALDVTGLTSGLTAITAGAYYSCALIGGGGIKCWGRNDGGQLGDGTKENRLLAINVSDPASGATAITGGVLHTCALLSGGVARCWGSNFYGQLGDATQTDHLTAVNPLIAHQLSPAGGTGHTCIPVANGGLRCWGTNSDGQLGDGTLAPRPTAVNAVGLGLSVAAVVTGAYHTCALTVTGGVKCWGRNLEGQLGDGTNTRRLNAVDVSGLVSGVSSLAAGAFHTCAITDSGSVKCWGWNGNGQLGDGTTSPRAAPVDVIGLSNVIAITAGDFHTCAVTRLGAAKCWGLNSNGQLGDSTVANRFTPIDVTGLTGAVVTVAAGARHTCAITGGGAAKCWGDNAFGQLGNNTLLQQATPVDVSGIASGAIAIAGGDAHTCALVGGAVKCWGDNSRGQLGDSTTTMRLAPALASGIDTGTAIAAGFAHTCALTSAGNTKCWGWNGSGQLGDGTTTGRTAAIDVLVNHGGKDFNGDSASDILWRRASDGYVTLWLMNGATLTLTAGLYADPAWTIVGTGDFNGDGKSDILWRRAADGFVTVWLMNGTSIIGQAGLYADPAWTIIGTGDFNGDGKSDILWRRAADGLVTLWLMNGASVVGQASLYADPAWTIVGTGDFNGDGKTDILWRRASDGLVTLWLMNGTTLMAVAGLYADPAWTVVGTGDFNGDGKSDILWRRAADGLVTLWLMNGASIGAQAGLYADPAWTVVGTGDFNGDGKSDILWRRAADGFVTLWLMNGTSLTAVAGLYADPAWTPIGMRD